MITTTEMLEVLTLLEGAGIKPPWTDATGKATMAKTYAALLGDVTAADVQAAAVAYIRSPLPTGQFWKAWPDVGVLLAQVPRRQLATLDDSDAAWAEVKRWCESVAGHVRDGGNGTMTGYGREPVAGDLDQDPGRDAAMRAGLQAIGGCRAYLVADISQEHHTSRRFREAYKQARTNRAVEGGVDVLRLLQEHLATKRLPGAKAGGFQKVLG